MIKARNVKVRAVHTHDFAIGIPERRRHGNGQAAPLGIDIQVGIENAVFLQAPCIPP